MKPKPLASLNHFTVPVMRDMLLFLSPLGALTVMLDPARKGRTLVPNLSDVIFQRERNLNNCKRPCEGPYVSDLTKARISRIGPRKVTGRQELLPPFPGTVSSGRVQAAL